MACLPLFLALISTGVLAQLPNNSQQQYLRTTCSIPGEKCKPSVHCSPFFTEDESPQSCMTSSGIPGSCCPDILFTEDSDQRILSEEDASQFNFNEDQYTQWKQLDKINKADRDAGSEKAFEYTEEIVKFEEFLKLNNIKVRHNSKEEAHHFVTKATPEARILGMRALQNYIVTKTLTDRLGLSEPDIELRAISMEDTSMGDRCPELPDCSDTKKKYRTFDGSCNNAHKTWLGRAHTAVSRLLPACYYDKIFEPRRAKSGEKLPKPRIISTSLSNDLTDNPPNRRVTVFLADYGQFLAHDFILSPTFTLNDGSPIQCCTENSEEILPKKLLHPQCIPIEIPVQDHFFIDHGKRCMNFVRTVIANRYNCSLGAAQQMNINSHWFDASTIYGSSYEVALQLRGPRGTLRVQGSGRGTLPPTLEGGCIERKKFVDNKFCFFSGDPRANEQPVQASIHTLFMREHNRIATEFATLHPDWSDDAIYHEARRIVAAEMQHIGYNEFLTVLLGKDFMKRYKLFPLSNGYTNDYDPKIDGRVTNEFGAAAYRLHTYVRAEFKFTDKYGNHEDEKLREFFNSPQVLPWPESGDKLIRGEARQLMGAFDQYFTEEMTEYMYEGEDDGGFDIISLNIQRGRDHGLRPYNYYRKLCGLPYARSFSDLDNFKPEALKVIKRLYEHVDDIDLWVGGTAERRVKGAMLGHTFLCIVGDQFSRFKRADRFFYELKNQPSSFTKAQLQEIRKSSMARIICDNSVDIQKIQRLAFLKADERTNPYCSCESPEVPSLDLTVWNSETPAYY